MAVSWHGDAILHFSSVPILLIFTWRDSTQIPLWASCRPWLTLLSQEWLLRLLILGAESGVRDPVPPSLGSACVPSTFCPTPSCHHFYRNRSLWWEWWEGLGSLELPGSLARRVQQGWSIRMPTWPTDLKFGLQQLYQWGRCCFLSLLISVWCLQLELCASDLWLSEEGCPPSAKTLYCLLIRSRCSKLSHV